jgi:hypothetical protein
MKKLLTLLLITTVYGCSLHHVEPDGTTEYDIYLLGSEKITRNHVNDLQYALADIGVESTFYSGFDEIINLDNKPIVVLGSSHFKDIKEDGREYIVLTGTVKPLSENIDVIHLDPSVSELFSYLDEVKVAFSDNKFQTVHVLLSENTAYLEADFIKEAKNRGLKINIVKAQNKLSAIKAIEKVKSDVLVNDGVANIDLVINAFDDSTYHDNDISMLSLLHSTHYEAIHVNFSSKYSDWTAYPRVNFEDMVLTIKKALTDSTPKTFRAKTGLSISSTYRNKKRISYNDKH